MAIQISVRGLAVGVGGELLRPAAVVIRVGATAERAARVALRDLIGRTALAAVDDVLASWYAEQVVARIIDSGMTERALSRALRGELVGVAIREVRGSAAVEQVTEELLAGDALERAIARAEMAELPQRIVERLFSDGLAEELAARLLGGPELERLLTRALDSPAAERLLGSALASAGMERLVARVVESALMEETISRVVDETLERLPRRLALWKLIDEVAQSSAVTEAIAHQGVGFADQVAGEVREHSRHADDRLEQAARRLFRRRGKGAGPSGPVPEPGAP